MEVVLGKSSFGWLGITSYGDGFFMLFSGRIEVFFL